MSADNGIYIMKFKDQYRVKHMQAVENLCFSFLNRNNSTPVPTRLVEYYGNTKNTRNLETAHRVAQAMLRNIGYAEYGIQILSCPYTWNEAVILAKELAPKEIEVIKNKENSTSYEYDLKQLERIVSE